METITETETEQSSQPKTIKKVSKCRFCGCELEYSPMVVGGKTFDFAPSICAPCSVLLQARERDKAQAEKQRKKLEHWKSICPTIYLETDEARLPKAQWDQARAWDWRTGKSLLLHGVTGKSKTRIAWLALKRYFEHDDSSEETSIVALTAAEFSRQSSDNAANGKSQSWADNLIAVGCLFIDDLGKGRMTDRNESDLFDILDRRFAFKRPNIITTNTVGEELEKRLDPDRGAPFVRRLREFCDRISFS
jgi:DNA replication protein DnaC